MPSMDLEEEERTLSGSAPRWAAMISGPAQKPMPAGGRAGYGEEPDTLRAPPPALQQPPPSVMKKPESAPLGTALVAPQPKRTRRWLIALLIAAIFFLLAVVATLAWLLLTR